MTAIKLALNTGAIALCLAFLAGCMPSDNGGKIGTADEYVYKGRPDQLMSEPAVNRQAKLLERFRLIQARQ